MKKVLNIQWLSIICLVVLLGLFSIQYYLLRNTYRLQKAEYKSTVKKQLDPIVNSEVLDSLKDGLEDDLRELVLLKLTDSLSESTLKSALLKKVDSVKQLGNAYLKKNENEYPVLKEVDLSFMFTEVVYRVNAVTDTVLKITDIPIVYFGSSLATKEEFVLNSGNFYGAHKDTETNLDENYWGSYKVVVDMQHWQQRVLLKMFWMLLAALVLLLAVVLLFFVMYRAMLQQKHIADIKTDFANNISHELKTPITSVGLIIKSLRKNGIAVDENKKEELLKSLERQNNRMHQIVERVLETSMDINILKTKVDINELLTTVIEDFKANGSLFNTVIDETIGVITTDGIQLQRVLYNLLENAKKYGNNQQIELKAYKDASSLYIAISDSGIGIAKTEFTGIFDKFYRISEGNVHNVKGLGLGLYLSKQIMYALGGEINVTSQLGMGSTFTIKLTL